MENFEKRLESQPPPGIDVEDERLRQVIVRGWDRDTEAAEIVKKIEEVLGTNERRKHVTEVFTFTDPAAIGVITFASCAAKNGFWRKIRNHGIKLSNDHMLKFESNETFEVRTRNQAMNQIKYQMIQKLGLDVKNIKINRRCGEVKLGSGKVAEVKEDGSMIFTDGIKEIKAEVEAHMEEWVRKRTQPIE
jgi:hypothetical protein